jgi:hypothetical protein
MKSEDLKKALDHLEAEKRARALGLRGPHAAACADWMRWMTEPGINIQNTLGSDDAPTQAPSISNNRHHDTCVTTTFSRAEEPLDLSEITGWKQFVVSVRNPDKEGDHGQVEEAEYAVANGGVVLRDLDGRFIVRCQLNGEDAAVVARRLLRERHPRRRSNVIQFPKMGVA